MSCDCYLYVERRGQDGVWRPVDKWDVVVRRRARVLFPEGLLDGARLTAGASALMLEGNARDMPRDHPGVVEPRVRCWPVEQDYVLFTRLAGVRSRTAPPREGVRFPPRGIPADVSIEILAQLPFPFGIEKGGGDHTPSWLTFAELLLAVSTPWDDERHSGTRFQAYKKDGGFFAVARHFHEGVLTPMSWASGADRRADVDHVRAVFWFEG